MRADLRTAMEQAAGRMRDGVAVVPVMSTGASDSVLLRNAGIPMQGMSGLSFEPGDYRAHGRDEGVPVRGLCESGEFMLAMLKEIAR